MPRRPLRFKAFNRRSRKETAPRSHRKCYSSKSATAAALREEGRGFFGAVTYAYGSSGISGSRLFLNNRFKLSRAQRIGPLSLAMPHLNSKFYASAVPINQIQISSWHFVIAVV
jgi:hypothetical protein